MSTCNTYALSSLWWVSPVQLLGGSFCPLTLVGQCKDNCIDYCPITVIKHLRSSWQGGHGRRKGSCDFLFRSRWIRKWSKGRQLVGWRTSRPAPVTHFFSTAQPPQAAPPTENLVFTTWSCGRPFVPKPRNPWPSSWSSLNAKWSLPLEVSKVLKF